MEVLGIIAKYGHVPLAPIDTTTYTLPPRAPSPPSIRNRNSDERGRSPLLLKVRFDAP